MSLDSSSRSRASTRIAGKRVRIIDAPVLVTHEVDGSAGEHGSMTVAPRVEGNRITAIELSCGCGQSVTIECVYDDALSGDDDAPVSDNDAPAGDDGSPVTRKK